MVPTGSHDHRWAEPGVSHPSELCSGIRCDRFRDGESGASAEVYMLNLLRRGPLTALALGIADLGKQTALRSYPVFLQAARTPPNWLDQLGPFAALRAAAQAQRRVPAYRAILTRS